MPGPALRRVSLSVAIAVAGLVAAIALPAAGQTAPDVDGHAAPPLQQEPRQAPGPGTGPAPRAVPPGAQQAPPGPGEEGPDGGQALLKIDVIRLQRGLRASQVIGAAVYNDAKAKIGTLDDLIIEGGDRLLFGVISVGGFLGVGERLVAVPYQALIVRSDRVVLNGVTKADLEKAPEFRYAKATTND